MLSFREEMFKESNSAAIQYAKNAIQFSFFLNGAAATALFAKDGKSFIVPACIFACGAAFAAICMGLTYLVQSMLSKTWIANDQHIEIQIWNKKLRISFDCIEKIRLIALVIWFFSILLFFSASIATLISG